MSRPQRLLDDTRNRGRGSLGGKQLRVCLVCLTGFFSSVPTMFFYSLPPPSRSHHPSLALFAPLHAQARLQVHHPRGGHATSRVASARNLNPGSTTVCARCDRGWPRPKSSHTVRKASESQTTPGQPKGLDLQPSFQRVDGSTLPVFGLQATCGAGIGLAAAHR